MIEEEIINKAGEIINQYNLQTRSRKPEFVFPRYFLMDFLKKNTHLSLADIGLMFGKLTKDGFGDHSIVLYGLKTHKMLTKQKYGDYILHTKGLADMLNGIELDLPPEIEQTLRQKVLDCDNYLDMVKLQKSLLSLQPLEV